MQPQGPVPQPGHERGDLQETPAGRALEYFRVMGPQALHPSMQQTLIADDSRRQVADTRADAMREIAALRAANDGGGEKDPVALLESLRGMGADQVNLNTNSRGDYGISNATFRNKTTDEDAPKPGSVKEEGGVKMMFDGKVWRETRAKQAQKDKPIPKPPDPAMKYSDKETYDLAMRQYKLALIRQEAPVLDVTEAAKAPKNSYFIGENGNLYFKDANGRPQLVQQKSK
jgi:hypothetical protein